ncbi:ABC transporter ATP-binding protein [Bifidobacterium bombi]|uniref:ABC transporter ATP-binding protein n=1 Tax=Bifidobacterium bombi TaxID=471511 RepID=UPI0009DD4C05|nr:ABC transporter ATP-binding protein [Bifidobacterium bombi]
MPGEAGEAVRFGARNAVAPRDGSATRGEQSTMVQVRDVGHRFPGTALLYEHVSFDVAAGQLLAVTGPSGSGKSTLLSLIAGWDKPTLGTVEVPRGARICWVFQNPYGPCYRTVLDIASFPIIARNVPRALAQEQAAGLLDDFGLAAKVDSRFCDLSGGEAQRLMLVRAICCAPDLLLVDEPTAQLDMRSARQVGESLSLLASRGMAVIVATHDPFVWKACDAVVDLERFMPLADAEGGAHAVA